MQRVKKFVFSAVMAVIAAAAVMPAHAQDNNRMSVNVPFDFVVGKSTLRGGQYNVEKLPTGVLVFSTLDGHFRRYALLGPGEKADDRNGGRYLVFTRYGHEAFLSKIIFSPKDGYDLPRTGREKEIIASVAPSHDVAMVTQPAQ